MAVHLTTANYRTRSYPDIPETVFSHHPVESTTMPRFQSNFRCHPFMLWLYRLTSNTNVLSYWSLVQRNCRSILVVLLVGSEGSRHSPRALVLQQQSALRHPVRVTRQSQATWKGFIMFMRFLVNMLRMLSTIILIGSNWLSCESSRPEVSHLAPVLTPWIAHNPIHAILQWRILHNFSKLHRMQSSATFKQSSQRSVYSLGSVPQPTTDTTWSTPSPLVLMMPGRRNKSALSKINLKSVSSHVKSWKIMKNQGKLPDS